ncbi:unnamed protein product [Acanthoscelides obtectus]|uniref:Uncharacterized protein n=1 Tax=Acanthoscelides obtectus TaxID=200917 RepID=A0A9P0KLW0_ACAOB|nr:unnamed protein product [Acanthoscelides obtectus]CAK1623650.1 hypothetical protein AOBTE_LOCUS2103 [Acanthoscelides obtectus]
MSENRKSKKRKIQELLQDLLENSSVSEISDGPQPSDDEDPEMTCPIADLSKANRVQPPNCLLALLEKKTSDNLGPEVHSDILDLLSVFSRFLKGIYRQKPPQPKYQITWDPSLVLDYLAKMYPLPEVSLPQLTCKLVTLLALLFRMVLWAQKAL